MGKFNLGTGAELGDGSGGGAREEEAWGEGSVSFCEECPMKGGRECLLSFNKNVATHRPRSFFNPSDYPQRCSK